MEGRAALLKPGSFRLRDLDRVVAKGRVEPLGVYEILDALPSGLRDLRALDGPRFAGAVALYRAVAFAEAGTAFASFVQDPGAAVLAARCDSLLANPPEGWNGVWKLEGK